MDRRGMWMGGAVLRALRVAALAAALAVVACGSEPFSLEASGPFVYPAEVNPALERVAILVRIANHSPDDLQVNPTDFVARDADHRIYPSNPSATIADARLVRFGVGPQVMQDMLPLPAVLLRRDDVLSGFVVFDVPAGIRPVELIFRQTDTDRVVELISPR